MPADFVIKAGDEEPYLTDELKYSNSSTVNLEGATVKFVMRTTTSQSAVGLTGHLSIINAPQGHVQFAFSAADTAAAGMFLASWIVTFPTGKTMTFPTEGYLWISVEQALTTTSQAQLVGLPEVLDYLNNPASDRIHDKKLLGWIEAVRPLIEFETGPIIPQKFDEWHDGGHPWITLRHRPRTGIGTTPLLRVAACSEYLGPVEWPLAIVSSPDLGELYSCMVDVRLGRVVRRTAGGGTQPFPYQPQAVHVVYEAGQEQVPENVQLAALETIAWWHSTQQPTGKGRMRAADDEGGKPSVGLPYHALSILGPTKRIKGIA